MTHSFSFVVRRAIIGNCGLQFGKTPARIRLF